MPGTGKWRDRNVTKLHCPHIWLYFGDPHLASVTINTLILWHSSFMMVITGIIISRHFPDQNHGKAVCTWFLSLCIDSITMLSYWVSNSSIFFIATRTSVLLLHHKEATRAYQRLCWCVRAFLLAQLLILWQEYTLAYGYNIFYHAGILLCTDSSLCTEFWVFASCDFLKCACAIMVSIAQGLCKLCNS